MQQGPLTLQVESTAAPAVRSVSVTCSFPVEAAKCRAVQPACSRRLMPLYKCRMMLNHELYMTVVCLIPRAWKPYRVVRSGYHISAEPSSRPGSSGSGSSGNIHVCGRSMLSDKLCAQVLRANGVVHCAEGTCPGLNVSDASRFAIPQLSSQPMGCQTSSSWEGGAHPISSIHVSPPT
jgi:hypothetical protein